MRTLRRLLALGGSAALSLAFFGIGSAQAADNATVSILHGVPGATVDVWLINGDGQRMYSLGVLPESGPATYPLSTLLADGRMASPSLTCRSSRTTETPSTHATVRFEAVCRGNDGSPASSVALWMP